MTVKIPDQAISQVQSTSVSDREVAISHASDTGPRIPSPLLYQKKRDPVAAAPTIFTEHRPPSPLLYHAQRDTSEDRYTIDTNLESQLSRLSSPPQTAASCVTPETTKSAIEDPTFVAACLPLMGEALNPQSSASEPRLEDTVPAKRTTKRILPPPTRRKLPAVSRLGKTSQFQGAESFSPSTSSQSLFQLRKSRLHPKDNNFMICSTSKPADATASTSSQQLSRGRQLVQSATRIEYSAKRHKQDQLSHESNAGFKADVTKTTCLMVFEPAFLTRPASFMVSGSAQGYKAHDSERVPFKHQEAIRGRIKEVVDWVIADLSLESRSISAKSSKSNLSRIQTTSSSTDVAVPIPSGDLESELEVHIKDDHGVVEDDWDMDWMWEDEEEEDDDWEASFEDFFEDEIEYMGLASFGL